MEILILIRKFASIRFSVFIEINDGSIRDIEPDAYTSLCEIRFSTRIFRRHADHRTDGNEIIDDNTNIGESISTKMRKISTRKDLFLDNDTIGTTLERIGTMEDVEHVESEFFFGPDLSVDEKIFSFPFDDKYPPSSASTIWLDDKILCPDRA